MARVVCSSAPLSGAVHFLELELELIQTQMAQKPLQWAEVYARAFPPNIPAGLRARVSRLGTC